ncbi:MAG: exo-beta-N-acetylmuramidase NamZ domain-containing protein [Byssovorax sp.]
MSPRRLGLCSLALLLGCSHRSAPTPPEAITTAIVDAGEGDADAAIDAAIADAEAPRRLVEDAAAPKVAVAPPTVIGPLGSIDEVAQAAVDRGDVTGAVIAVVRGQEIVFHHAYGLRTKDPDEPMKVDTVFDLASLTKALATAPSILLLVEQKKLSLATPVAKYLPVLGSRGKDAITVEQLLLHTSGLRADIGVGDFTHGRDEALRRIGALPLESDPGARFEYSDLGYIALGALVEKIAGAPLDAFARASFYAPLGMRDTTFSPPPALAARAAPTAKDGDAYLQGVAHDPRARALGGVAGHAGLFSTVDDVARFATMLLNRGEIGGTRVLAASTVAALTLPHELPDDAGKRALGWDIDTRFSGVRGELHGYGHTGFTGTSVWIDPSRKTAVVVLSSAPYPDGKGDVRRLRREVATVVARSVGAGGVVLAGATKSPAAAIPAAIATGSVLTGIDVLERDAFKPLQGRRVGLVTHAAGRDRRGASTIDALRAAPGVTLVALFSPEHGLRSEEDHPVRDGKDERSGLPIYSLYGERTRPTDAELAGIDTLVVDLQDAGARFYTYATTLGYLLETAAKAHLRVVVLDRPNPLGGARVEGPMLDASRTSFTGYHPIPIRHGMTLGELARLFNGERKLGADLQIVPIEGWKRADTFDRTGLVWTNPSPNLRSVTEALLYPGVALLEGTNVSVGRGTTTPFEHVGAPWIEGPKLAAALTAAGLRGVHFTATSFTPSSSTFSGKACEGVAIGVDDRAALDPIRIGLTLARALMTLYPADFQPKGLLLLLGNQATYDALTRGDPVETIVASWAPELAAFAPVRARTLLYP